MMRSAAILICLAVGLTAWAGTYHNQPDSEEAGGITAVIQPAEGLQTVIVIEPYELKAYEANVDKKSGRINIRGLVPGEYDLLIKTVGHVYEGVTLEVDPDQSPSPAELKTICEEVGETFFTSEDYFNVKRIVRLTGDGEQSRMIVAQTRNKLVVAPSGATIHGHIRRIDLVEMRKTAKVYQLVTGRHLLRQEVPFKSPDIKIEFTHSPKLGRILVGETITDVGRIDLRRLPEALSGKYADAKYTVPSQ